MTFYAEKEAKIIEHNETFGRLLPDFLSSMPSHIADSLLSLSSSDKKTLRSDAKFQKHLKTPINMKDSLLNGEILVSLSGNGAVFVRERIDEYLHERIDGSDVLKWFDVENGIFLQKSIIIEFKSGIFLQKSIV